MFFKQSYIFKVFIWQDYVIHDIYALSTEKSFPLLSKYLIAMDILDKHGGAKTNLRRKMQEYSKPMIREEFRNL